MSRSKLGSNAKIEIPTPADRINRVLRFMDNYLPRIDVQIAALNAVINFAKNADAPTTTKHTDIVNIVAKAFIQHIEVKEVVWRSCVAFATLASYSSEIALEIILTNAHEVAIDQFFKYDVEPVVQQQVLWLLASLLEWPRSKRVLHKSVKCMDFLKKMFALEEEKKLAVMNEVKNEAPQPSKKGNNNTIKVKALKFNLTTNTEAKELDPEINDQLKSNITTIIPLIIRTFYRESEGKTYEELKMAEKVSYIIHYYVRLLSIMVVFFCSQL